jgi:hypothetical protein
MKFLAHFLSVMLFVILLVPACRPRMNCGPPKATIRIAGQELTAVLHVPAPTRLHLSITMSNGSESLLTQEAARGDLYPQNFVAVHRVLSAGQQEELPLTAEGSNACLKGELWVAGGRYSSRPIQLLPGSSRNWTYPLDRYFDGITSGTFRVTFIPTAVDGFGHTNFGPSFPYRFDLAMSNICITLPRSR